MQKSRPPSGWSLQRLFLGANFSPEDRWSHFEFHLRWQPVSTPPVDKSYSPKLSCATFWRERCQIGGARRAWSTWLAYKVETGGGMLLLQVQKPTNCNRVSRANAAPCRVSNIRIELDSIAWLLGRNLNKSLATNFALGFNVPARSCGDFNFDTLADNHRAHVDLDCSPLVKISESGASILVLLILLRFSIQYPCLGIGMVRDGDQMSPAISPSTACRHSLTMS